MTVRPRRPRFWSTTRARAWHGFTLAEPIRGRKFLLSQSRTSATRARGATIDSVQRGELLSSGGRCREALTVKLAQDGGWPDTRAAVTSSAAHAIAGWLTSTATGFYAGSTSTRGIDNPTAPNPHLRVLTREHQLSLSSSPTNAGRGGRADGLRAESIDPTTSRTSTFPTHARCFVPLKRSER